MTDDDSTPPTDAEEAFRAAKTLPPDERLRLALRLWGSLPPDFWAAPSAAELAETHFRLNEHDAGRTSEQPWDVVQRAIEYRTGMPPPKIYSAPRRFDLATIFVVMAAFSILLAGLSAGLTALELPPSLSLFAAVFIALVAAGQALLFRGKKPRLASALVGIACYTVPVLIGVLMAGRMMPNELLIIYVLQGVIFGALFGYVAGALVGGVFLVADVVRKAFARPPRNVETGQLVESVPADA